MTKPPVEISPEEAMPRAEGCHADIREVGHLGKFTPSSVSPITVCSTSLETKQSGKAVRNSITGELL